VDDACDLREATHFAIARFLTLSVGTPWEVYDCAVYDVILRCGGFSMKICKTGGIYEVDCGDRPIWNSVCGALPALEAAGADHQAMMDACGKLHVAYKSAQDRLKCEQILAAASISPVED
jgi:hypothetical protein